MADENDCMGEAEGGVSVEVEEVELSNKPQNAQRGVKRGASCTLYSTNPLDSASQPAPLPPFYVDTYSSTFPQTRVDHPYIRTNPNNKEDDITHL